MDRDEIKNIVVDGLLLFDLLDRIIALFKKAGVAVTPENLRVYADNLEAQAIANNEELGISDE